MLLNNFPPIVGVRWFNVSVLTLTPAIAGYGLLVAPVYCKTAVFAVLYYVFSMLGEPLAIIILALI